MSLDSSADLLELLDIQWPIIQAPMAGTGTPALAAAVSNAGGLGSLGVGATTSSHDPILLRLSVRRNQLFSVLLGQGTGLQTINVR
jgi:NAD(P)H-dependent flavin oxidoreductase YrpB (nitropropane dioxygenase family)